jgi:hypothetical protein
MTSQVVINDEDGTPVVGTGFDLKTRHEGRPDYPWSGLNLNGLTRMCFGENYLRFEINYIILD